MFFFSAALFAQRNDLKSLSKEALSAKGEQKADIFNEMARIYLNISLEKSVSYSDQAMILASRENYIKGLTEALFLNGYGNVHLGNIELSRKNFEKGLELSQKHNFDEKEGAFLLQIGHIFYNHGNFLEARNYYQMTLQKALLDKNTLLEAKATNFIGKYYHSLGEFDQSLIYFNKARQLCNNFGSPPCLPVILNNIGKYYETTGDFDKALSYFLRSKSFLEENKNAIIHASTCNHIGNIYQDLNFFDKSLQFHNIALRERKKINYREGIAKSLKNIGEVYLEQEKLADAKDCFNASLDICLKINYKKGIVKGYNNLGIIYALEGEHEKAMDCYQKSLGNALEMGYDKGVVRVYTNIGELYKQSGNLAKAIEYFNKSLDLAVEKEQKKAVRKNYLALSDLYAETGNHQKALEFYKLFKITEDELISTETTRRIAEAQISYETEKKEKENELLRKENEIKNLQLANKNIAIILFTSISILLVVLVVFIYSRFENKKRAHLSLEALNKKIVAQNNKLEKLNKELNHANKEKDKFFGIIAHELRNPLFWFKNLASVLSKNFHKMEPQKVNKALESLDESAKNAFHLMDNLLNWSRNQLGHINYSPVIFDVSELENDVIHLFKSAADSKSIQLQSHIPKGTLVFADKDLVVTVLRNLTSNALKYTPVHGKIHINCRDDGNNVMISVEDSGVGISKENLEKLFKEHKDTSTPGLEQEKGSGLGLMLCKEFVQINKGEIKVESEVNAGTKIVFSLPRALKKVEAEKIKTIEKEFS